MGLKRDVSLETGLRYRGGAPMLTFVMHRIGGSALFIFFTIYILSLLGVESMHAILRNWFFQVLLLIFGLFHVINGLRITILDLSPRLIQHYRTAIRIAWAAYAVAAVFAFVILINQALGD